MDIKILSIETSGYTCSIALSHNNEIVSIYTINKPNVHDELAAELIKRILDDNKMDISNLSAIAVSSGPGSFTGLRIGVSIAKGLCFRSNESELNPKLIAVQTLKSLIDFAIMYKHLINKDKIISVIPAQKDYVYYQTYKSGNYSKIIMENKLALEKNEYNSYFKIGPYYHKLNEYNIFNSLSAEKIAISAYKQFLKNEFTDPDKYSPDYIQDFVIKTHKKSLNI